MKKILFITLILLFFGYSYKSACSLPNPWIDCGDDFSCASKKSGFNFPLKIKNYSIRAMKDMIEVKFNLDRKREVTIRKSVLYDGIADEYGIKDISGDYNNYPVNKVIKIKDGIPFHVRGDKNKFYVVSFGAETGYYSISCAKGLKIKDIKYFYNLLSEAEAPRWNFEKEKTLEELMDSRRVDGIVEPVFTQDCFPRTLEKKGVTLNCFERANLGDDSSCSLSQIKMIKEYYKKGQDKDPLNNGQDGFCAD